MNRTARTGLTAAALVVSTAFVSAGALTASAVTPSPTPTATSSATATASPTPTPTPTPSVPYPVATSQNKWSGHTTNGRTITLHGTHFLNVRSVQVGGYTATKLVIDSDTTLHFWLGPQPMYQAGPQAITLVAASDGAKIATALAFTYKAVSALDKEMQYAFANWNASSSSAYGYLKDNDCTNFVSQILVARGWSQTADWYNRGTTAATAAAAKQAPVASSAWLSATALSTWLATQPMLATKLTYAQRDQVQVGDIVQFRYSKKGSWWDHSAVVSEVSTAPDGHLDIHYVAHTLNRTYGGGTYWLANYDTPIAIQFWHLNR